jgi:hypothetical protein
MRSFPSLQLPIRCDTGCVPSDGRHQWLRAFYQVYSEAWSDSRSPVGYVVSSQQLPAEEVTSVQYEDLWSRTSVPPTCFCDTGWTLAGDSECENWVLTRWLMGY